MSTLTLTAPTLRCAGSLPTARRPAAPVRSSTCARPTSARVAAPPRLLRVTARGQALVRAAAATVLTSAVIAALVAVTALTSAAASAVSSRIGGVGGAGANGPVRYVTVAAGQTLWGIAGDVAPGDDRRDVVAEILALNGLDGGHVQAGQRLAVPISR